MNSCGRLSRGRGQSQTSKRHKQLHQGVAPEDAPGSPGYLPRRLLAWVLCTELSVQARREKMPGESQAEQPQAHAWQVMVFRVRGCLWVPEGEGECSWTRLGSLWDQELSSKKDLLRKAKDENAIGHGLRLHGFIHWHETGHLTSQKYHTHVLTSSAPPCDLTHHCTLTFMSLGGMMSSQSMLD